MLTRNFPRGSGSSLRSIRIGKFPEASGIGGINSKSSSSMEGDMPMSVEWRPVAGAGIVGEGSSELSGVVGEGSSELSESSITAGGMGVWMNGVAGGGGRGLTRYARGVVTAGLLALRGIFFREEGSD